MNKTKKAMDRLTKLAKKLPPEAVACIEAWAEELARIDLLSSAVHIKHMNQAYERWKQEQGAAPDPELEMECEDGLWLGQHGCYACWQQDGQVILMQGENPEQSQAAIHLTPEEAYDLFRFLKEHKHELFELLSARGKA